MIGYDSAYDFIDGIEGRLAKCVDLCSWHVTEVDYAPNAILSWI